MNEKYSPEEWHKLATNIYDLIMIEINASSPEIIDQTYPNLIIMYEFFRLLRGHAFSTSRPSGLGDLQNDLYQKEYSIHTALRSIEKEINTPHNKYRGMTIYHLNRMKKSFDLPDIDR